MATGGGQDASNDVTVQMASAGMATRRSLDAVEHLIYRNKRFLECKLCVSETMIALFTERGLFPVEQMTEFQDLFQQHRGSPTPCQQVNDCLVTMVLKYLKLDRQVDGFLECLEDQQPEIARAILGGETLRDLRQGPLSIGHSSTAMIPLSEVAGVLSPAQSGSMTLHSSTHHTVMHPAIPRDEFPEPDVPFQETEYCRSMSPSAAEECFVEPVIAADGKKRYGIGPAGGVFRACDDMVTVRIPPGALDETHHLYVECEAIQQTRDTPDGLIYLGKVLFLGPHGLSFSKPVQLTVRDNKLQTDQQAIVFHSNTGDGELPDFHESTAMGAPTMDADTLTVSFDVVHFSVSVYVLVGLGISAAVVTMALANRDISVCLYAKEPLDRDNITVKLVIDDSAEMKTVADGFRLVTHDHDFITMAMYDRLCVTMVAADGDVDSALLPWKLRMATCKRFSRLPCPYSRDHTLVRTGSNGCPFPFHAVLHCQTTHTNFGVNVPFDIASPGSRELGQAATATTSALPPALSEPTKCPSACHTAVAVSKPELMSSARKRTLAAFSEHLAKSLPCTHIDTVLLGLASCKVFPLGSREFQKIRNSSVSQEKMQELVHMLATSANGTFDCFCHALQHAACRPDLADKLRKWEAVTVQEEQVT